MNPRTRLTALYAIGAIAILASADALAHSYTGLYDWAITHRLNAWQSLSWPAEIDVFLAVGELALYVAYLVFLLRSPVQAWIAALCYFKSISGMLLNAILGGAASRTL